MGLITTEVQGLEPLIQKLSDMTSPVRVRKVALKVLEPGAKATKAAIAAEAPVNPFDRKGRQGDKPGNLKRGVRYKASKTRNVEYWGGTPAVAAYIVGPFGKGTAHRHLVVAGHNMRGHKRTLLGVNLGHKNVGGLARTRANPFVQRGIDHAKDEAMNMIEAEAGAALEILANG